MNTKPLYLEDSYKKACRAKILEIKTDDNLTTVVLDQTVFYPVGGGQPADQGVIQGKNGKLTVEQVLLKGSEVKHIGKLEGKLEIGNEVDCKIDWTRRYHNMRVHSAGHLLHEAVRHLFPDLEPIEGEHGKKAYIKYKGNLEGISENLILSKANELIQQGLKIETEFVTLDELKRRSPWVPEHLPSNKPLRIMWIGNYPPIPDGGTQVKNTSEIGSFTYVQIDNIGEEVIVLYRISEDKKPKEILSDKEVYKDVNVDSSLLLNLKNQAIARIGEVKSLEELEEIRIDLFGKSGHLTQVTKSLKNLDANAKKQTGILINEIKNTLENFLTDKKNSFRENPRSWFDPTVPGIKPEIGNLHLVTKAIAEITDTFEKIGFTRVRYPEVDWDYYSFESLNMPKSHAARDEWETFFIEAKQNPKFGNIVLTPHTSNGQVREMERVKPPPIRMINIAKCYRRQSDASHYPMFHQFEGLVIDKNISIVHLKGTLDYFAKSFFGPTRKTRLRPYHFQFTEPSFEVDVSCGVCGGSGCKLCKEGWLEIGGAGMVHPNVLKAGKIDSKIYSGFAFGWGVERTYMMKEGLSIPDIRLLYSLDLRILRQF